MGPEDPGVPPAPAAAALPGVEHEVTVDQQRGDGGLGAAKERADTGDEVGEGERLGQIIVGAQPEALHPIVDCGRGREHEHPATGTGGDDRGAYLVAVQAGQVPVEHDHVVGRRESLLQSGRAVEGDVDGHLRPAQADADCFGELLIVFDHQYAHHRSSLCVPRAARDIKIFLHQD